MYIILRAGLVNSARVRLVVYDLEPDKNSYPSYPKKSATIWNSFPLLRYIHIYVRFPRGSSDRRDTIPVGPKCTFTLPLMARRCDGARKQSRRIDGTIFLGCCTFAKIDAGTREQLEVEDTAFHSASCLSSRGTRERTGEFSCNDRTLKCLFIYALCMHDSPRYM